MHKINWENLHYVLTVARTGSISGAARKLNVNRTTVLRRVNRFEDKLGITVFERSRKGFVLSAGAEQILEATARLEQTVNDLERQFIGSEPQLSGEIRITTTDSVYVSMIAPRLAEFQMAHPLIKIELSITNFHLNLVQRDSDVAFRPTKSPPDNMVCHKITEVEFGVFASRSYLKSAGNLPIQEYRWLGLDEPLLSAPVGQWFRKTISTEKIAMSSDSFLALRSAAEQGLGVTILPCSLAKQSTELKRIGPDMDEITTGLWLITHPDLARAGRIRAMIEHFSRQ